MKNRFTFLPFLGGGFGSKTLWQHQVLGATAAKLAGRAVRITLSREGVYRIIGGRALTEQRVAIGAERDGHFAAIIHTGIAAMTRHNALPEPFILPARSAYAGTGAAVANAIFNATGKRIRELPITLDKLI